MTRRNKIYLFSAFLILGATVFLKKSPLELGKTSDKTIIKNNVIASSVTPSSTQTRTPSAEKTDLPSEAANTISNEWEENLESALRVQGGPSLKNIHIEKLDSLIWKQDGIALHVETARITLTNDNNNQTSFKVMVDSQTGKILKNWDHPVIDPVNPREKFKLALDPRYHNE